MENWIIKSLVIFVLTNFMAQLHEKNISNNLISTNFNKSIQRIKIPNIFMILFFPTLLYQAPSSEKNIELSCTSTFLKTFDALTLRQ